MTSKFMSMNYTDLSQGIQHLLHDARRQAVKSIDSILVATYWEIGRRIVVYEQKGMTRAEYGEHLLARLAKDLSARLGRGFGLSNVKQMRNFYLTYDAVGKGQTRSGLFAWPRPGKKSQTPSAELGAIDLQQIAKRFPLSWSQYVRLLSLRSDEARLFFEDEAMRGGRSVRQLQRQTSDTLKSEVTKQAGDERTQP
jgi:hypothetical protein